MSRLDQCDGIVYINLEHRPDRRADLEDELRRGGIDLDRVHRIEGVYEPCLGHRGCLKSHIKALEFAQERGFESVLILEDDCYFKPSAERADQVVKVLWQIDQWDVLLLGTCVRVHHQTPWEGIYRVLWSTSAQAYVVRKHYYARLLSYFRELLESMGGNLFTAARKQFDFEWHALMVEDRWYCSEIVLQQRGSYSDTDNGWKSRLHPPTP